MENYFISENLQRTQSLAPSNNIDFQSGLQSRIVNQYQYPVRYYNTVSHENDYLARRNQESQSMHNTESTRVLYNSQINNINQIQPRQGIGSAEYVSSNFLYEPPLNRAWYDASRFQPIISSNHNTMVDHQNLWTYPKYSQTVMPHCYPVTSFNSQNTIPSSYDCYPVTSSYSQNTIPNSEQTEIEKSEIHSCIPYERSLRSSYDLRQHLETRKHIGETAAGAQINSAKMTSDPTKILMHESAPIQAAHCSSTSDQLSNTPTTSSINNDISGPLSSTSSESSTSSTTPKIFTLSTGQQTVAAKQVKCVDCNKVFTNQGYLMQHRNTRHSEKSFKCKRCGKRFATEASCNKHYARHIGDKRFKCNRCTKQFHHDVDLRRHFYKHRNTKPNVCGVCGRGYVRQDQLRSHLEMHSRRLAKSELNKEKEDAMNNFKEEWVGNVC